MNIIDLKPIAGSKAFCSVLGIPLGADLRFALLGHGEYNLNYQFSHPSTGDKLVLRIPMGSQMHLENQVRYEFEALRMLDHSGRTPRAFYMDDKKSVIPYGFLVMEYLPGKALQYESDLSKAAGCLADIHNMKIPQGHLLAPENPLEAIWEECSAMAGHYLDSRLALPETKRILSDLLEQGRRISARTSGAGERCVINTELNSGNFLVNDDGMTYLVDWEKPLYASVCQDLGHFLAPTTTFWKTDILLDEWEIQSFLRDYCESSNRYSSAEALWEETLPYFTITCLRGISWCAMAWLEYQNPERPLKDAFTFAKIETYLSTEFLERIRKDYFHG